MEKGETLYSLGKRFGLPVDSIAAYNEPILKDGLKEGSILRGPDPAARNRPTGTGFPAAASGNGTGNGKRIDQAGRRNRRH